MGLVCMTQWQKIWQHKLLRNILNTTHNHTSSVPRLSSSTVANEMNKKERYHDWIGDRVGCFDVQTAW